MSFNPNIPQGTDPILQSAQQIRANFIAINQAFDDNHVGLTQDPSIAGKHDVLTLRPQTLIPTTTNVQTSIYNKLVGGIPQLFFMPNNSQTPIQLTYQTIKTGLQSKNPDVYYDEQQTFLAGPFIVYAGIIKKPFNTGKVVNLTPGTTIYFLDTIATNIKSFKSSNEYTINSSIAGNSFTINFNSSYNGKIDVYYTAIGI